MMKNMMWKGWLHHKFGILVMRLVVGGIFFSHGITKLADMQATILMFQNYFHLGAGWAWAAALLETIGGLALALGIGTLFFGLLLAIEMAVVILWVKGFKTVTTSELELALFAMSLAVVWTGPGRFALGPHMCGCCKGGTCGTDGNCKCHWFCSSEDCGSGKNCKDENCTCETCDDATCGCGVCAVKGEGKKM